MSLYVSKNMCDDITVDLFIFSKSSFASIANPIIEFRKALVALFLVGL